VVYARARKREALKKMEGRIAQRRGAIEKARITAAGPAAEGEGGGRRGERGLDLTSGSLELTCKRVNPLFPGF